MTRPCSHVLSQEQRKALCQTLVRGASNLRRLEDQAVALLRSHPEELGYPMLHAAIENGGRGGVIIERALEWGDAPNMGRDTSLAIASAIEGHLPWPTTTLRRTAMIVGLLVTADQDGRIPDDVPFHQRLNLALRCFDAGETSMALALAESAWSELQEGSGRMMDRPIVLSLAINLMIFLHEANRLEEASEVAEVARWLISGFPDTWPRDEVAAYLCRYASSAALVHFALGQLDCAIRETEQAIEAAHLLLAHGDMSIRIELGRCYANLAMFLSAAGQPRTALLRALDGVRQARRAELSDQDAGMLALGFAFEALSGAAFNAGRLAIARSAIDRAKVIYSRLQEKPSGSNARRIASTFVNAASITSGVENVELRKEWILFGMSFLNSLDEARPGSVDSELSIGHTVAANILLEQGLLLEAIESIEYAELRARQDQSPPGKLRRLAIRANLAVIQKEAGRRKESLAIKFELEQGLAELSLQDRLSLPGVVEEIEWISRDIENSADFPVTRNSE